MGNQSENDRIGFLPEPINMRCRIKGKPHNQPMDQLLEKMRRRVIDHVDGIHAETPIPNLSLGVVRQPLIPETAFCKPMVCVVLQGVKQVLVGGQLLRYDAANCFASAVELPATGCVLEAKTDKPYIAMGLTLDHAMLANLVIELPSPPALPQTMGFGMATVSRELLEAFDSLLALLYRPDDIPILSKGREREVLYQLLRSQHAPMLRQALNLDSQLARIRRVIEQIRQQFDQNLSVAALANLAGMSVPSFHRHFKAATAMSPLQYQKTLRLHAARKLVVTGADAAQTAYAVGYESPSQFSREYSRLFGLSPARDGARLRQG
jgi:AraC-like DNA-binding protein